MLTCFASFAHLGVDSVALYAFILSAQRHSTRVTTPCHFTPRLPTAINWTIPITDIPASTRHGRNGVCVLVYRPSFAVGDEGSRSSRGACPAVFSCVASNEAKGQPGGLSRSLSLAEKTFSVTTGASDIRRGLTIFPAWSSNTIKRLSRYSRYIFPRVCTSSVASGRIPKRCPDLFKVQNVPTADCSKKAKLEESQHFS